MLHYCRLVSARQCLGVLLKKSETEVLRRENASRYASASARRYLRFFSEWAPTILATMSDGSHEDHTAGSIFPLFRRTRRTRLLPEKRSVDWSRTTLLNTRSTRCRRACETRAHLASGHRGDDGHASATGRTSRRARLTHEPNSTALFINVFTRTMGHAFVCFRYCLIAGAILLGVSFVSAIPRIGIGFPFVFSAAVP